MTESDLFALKENYVNMIVEGMDIDTLAQFAFDSIIANYEDCLLYTSPSPRDRTRSRMPSSA